MTVVILLVTFCSGPVVFANLYYVHDYYWFANAVYLVAAIGVGLWSIYTLGAVGRIVSVAGMTIIAAFGILRYPHSAYHVYQSSRDTSLVDLGKVISRLSKSTDVVMMLGFDWDGSLPYFSDRRAVMAMVDSDVFHPNTVSSVRSLPSEGRQLSLLVVTQNKLADGALMAGLRETYGFGLIAIYQDAKFAIFPVTSEKVAANSPLSIAPALDLTSSSGAIPVQPIEVNEEAAWLAHAPATLTFTTPDYPSTVSLHFGVDPRAYASNPATDGVEFLIQLEEESKARSILWSTKLTPRTRERDQGEHTIQLDHALPPRSRLILETRVGDGDGTWDWAFWKNIQIREIKGPQSGT